MQLPLAAKQLSMIRFRMVKSEVDAKKMWTFSRLADVTIDSKRLKY